MECDRSRRIDRWFPAAAFRAQERSQERSLWWLPSGVCAHRDSPQFSHLTLGRIVCTHMFKPLHPLADPHPHPPLCPVYIIYILPTRPDHSPFFLAPFPSSLPFPSHRL